MIFNFNASYVKEVSQEKLDSQKNTLSFNNLTKSETNSTADNFMVGPLSKKERDKKVRKYLEKKKRRKWTKKVNYQSRKKVADSRPRYKGRFVSFEHAGELLEEYKKDLEKKLIKNRVFITRIFNKKTGQLRKIIFPTEEAMYKYAPKDII